MMSEFQACVDCIDIDDYLSKGYNMTWCSKREEDVRIYFKLVRILYNDQRFVEFPNVEAKILDFHFRLYPNICSCYVGF